MKSTSEEYDKILIECKNIFINKMRDYGSSWRILRTSSITDQIFIKAQRIRSIEEKTIQKVNDGISDEYIGIVNYSIMALIQLESKVDISDIIMKLQDAEKLYDMYFLKAKDLMQNKNHDYGEAWRVMRICSFTDIILMRVLRIKQIEDNHGMTINSEGIDSNYLDIINYAMFALIKLKGKNNI